MSLADREFHRDRIRSTSGLTPVVKALLWINGVLFLLDYLLLPLVLGLRVNDFQPPLLVSLGAFRVQSAIFECHVWEFVTFQFLHGSLGHVLFNCMGLFFFGPWVEARLGAGKFIRFYLACGAAGAAFYTLLMLLQLIPGDTSTPLVGASAGIYGIFVGVAIIAPNLRVALLFPPVEMSMRQLAIALMVLSLVFVATGWAGNQGGEAGHLGGFIAGFLLMKFPFLLGNQSLPACHRNPVTVPAKIRPRSRIGGPAVDPEIDRILDKISRDGIHSVTEEEREQLRKFSQSNERP